MIALHPIWQTRGSPPLSQEIQMIRNGLSKAKRFWNKRWWFRKKEEHAQAHVPAPPRVKMHRLNVGKSVRRARLERRRHLKHVRRQLNNRRG